MLVESNQAKQACIGGGRGGGGGHGPSTFSGFYIAGPPLLYKTKGSLPAPPPRQAESTRVYTLYRKSPLKEDNLSTKDKTADPEGALIKRFHCIFI